MPTFGRAPETVPNSLKHTEIWKASDKRVSPMKLKNELNAMQNTLSSIKRKQLQTSSGQEESPPEKHFFSEEQHMSDGEIVIQSFRPNIKEKQRTRNPIMDKVKQDKFTGFTTSNQNDGRPWKNRKGPSAYHLSIGSTGSHFQTGRHTLTRNS